MKPKEYSVATLSKLKTLCDANLIHMIVNRIPEKTLNEAFDAHLKRVEELDDDDIVVCASDPIACGEDRHIMFKTNMVTLTTTLDICV